MLKDLLQISCILNSISKLIQIEVRLLISRWLFSNQKWEWYILRYVVFQSYTWIHCYQKSSYTPISWIDEKLKSIELFKFLVLLSRSVGCYFLFNLNNDFIYSFHVSNAVHIIPPNYALSLKRSIHFLYHTQSDIFSLVVEIASEKDKNEGKYTHGSERSCDDV